MNNAERDTILGISKWKEHLSEQPVEVSTTQLDVLRSPGVYVYLAGDKAAYIGKSKNVGERCFGKGHHKSELFKDCTSVIIFPCKSEANADTLEALLIYDLRPFGNGRGQRKYVKSLNLPYDLQNWQQNNLPVVERGRRVDQEKRLRKAAIKPIATSLAQSRRASALCALTQAWSAESENRPEDSPVDLSD